LVNKLRTRNEWSQEVANQITKRIHGKLNKPDLFAGIKNKLDNNKALNDEETSATIDALKKSFETWFVAGMYQFSPVPWGNIDPCIQSWNQIQENNSRCQIKKDVGQAARALMSSGQHFNALCGVHKVLHTFSTQANTSNTTGTDLDNLSSGTLRAPKDRCLTLVSRAGKGLQYAHFGPLRNSVKGRVNTSTGEKIPDNMEGLFRCVASAVPEGLKTRYDIEL
jgi:hypothetical protein